MASKRVRSLISGRVQGVAFRYYARDEAERLGVAGWVRNLRDGRVELLAEGDAASVDALIGWCRRGPPSARVEAVDVRIEEPVGETGPFRIEATSRAMEEGPRPLEMDRRRREEGPSSLGEGSSAPRR